MKNIPTSARERLFLQTPTGSPPDDHQIQLMIMHVTHCLGPAPFMQTVADDRRVNLRVRVLLEADFPYRDTGAIVTGSVRLVSIPGRAQRYAVFFLKAPKAHTLRSTPTPPRWMHLSSRPPDDWSKAQETFRSLCDPSRIRLGDTTKQH
jgi:hypothetical protein